MLIDGLNREKKTLENKITELNIENAKQKAMRVKKDVE
jgi:hypothetical protein